ELDPDNTLGWYYEGRVAFERDDFEGAIERLDRIDLDNPRVIADMERLGKPIYEEATKYKGIAEFALGDYEDAAQTFRELIDIYPSSFYYTYLYIVTALDGNEDPGIIKRGLKESPDEPFRMVLEFYNGDTEPEVLMHLAEDKETVLCLGFFIAMGYKVAGDGKLAKKYFKKAVDTGFTNGFEYRQAKRELEALGR
ncbi:MAG: tetratricopeptide repeat protein, partial [Candidatus Dadabacteria bacterium]|nr:tetratricopeptide repeat protein [Candidatus Dadabacteria bacterium]